MESLLANNKLSYPKSEKNLDLNNLTIKDLKILEEKQLKVLKNSTIIKNLPDGGNKIREYISKIRQAIEVKSNFDQTIEALNKLKVYENVVPENETTIQTIDALSKLKVYENETTNQKTQPNKQHQRISESMSIPENIDEKIDILKNKLNERPKPRSTHFLTLEELQTMNSKEALDLRQRKIKESQIMMEDFLGMFKVGQVKVVAAQDEYRQDAFDNINEEYSGNDSDSEVSELENLLDNNKIDNNDNDVLILDDCLD